MGYLVVNSEGGTISSLPASVTGTRTGMGGFSNAILNDNNRAPSADANVHEIHAEDSETRDRKYKPLSEQYSTDKPAGHEFKPIKEPLENVYQKPATQPSLDDIKKAKQEVEQELAESSRPNPEAGKPQIGDSSSSAVTHSSHSGKKEKWPPAPAREKWSDRPQLEQALAKVINLLPDEVHMRELIRPVDGSGKEKMREMGLRTRAYKKYFDAWEALHMTTDDEGATYIRDDLIPYLRSHQQSLVDAEFSEEGVEGLTLAGTIRQYENYRVFIQKFANLLFPWFMPYFSNHMTMHTSFKKGGRGIVLTAGDDQAPYLLTTIYSFRQLGCSLPIEVMYLGEQDLGEDYRAELESLPGVTTRDIAQMTNDDGWRLAGWAAKPFAILLSSFREVIFIDADSLFFKNPETLFEDPDYKRTGALFFRDRLIMPESKKRWLQQVLPKPIPKAAKESRWWTGDSGHQQESGVVVVDKWRHFVSLMLITRFNGPDRDGNKERGITGVYDMMYGDKETFWIGFLLAGDESWAFHAGDAGIMGELSKDAEQKPKRDAPPEEPQQAEAGSPVPDNAILSSGRTIVQDAEGPITVNQMAEILPESTQNYTVCAPQLLHLGTDGKPLWFNGWLLHNKFAEKSKKRFAAFEHYLVEGSNPHEWQLAESNMCCLTVDESRKFTFSAEERATLRMIMDRAGAMGMGDQS